MDGKTISIGVQINDYSASWIPTDAMTQGRLAWYGVQTYSHHSPSLPQSADPHAGHPGAIHSTSADNVKHDPHGPPNLHTPSFDTALSYWLGRNVPRSKIRLGIGFSGADCLTVDQLCDDIPDSGDPGRLRDYKDLADLVDDAGWTEHRDEAAIAKYFIATNRIVTMPTDFSVQASLRFAAAEHLPGMIVWAAGKDWIGGEPKLVKAMSQTVGVTRSLWLGARDFIASGAGASLAIVGTTGSDNRPVVWVFPASSGVITAAVTLPEGWLSAHPIVPILHWSRAAGTNGIVGWRIRTALVDVGDQVDEAPTTLLDPGPTSGPVTAETLALTPMGGVQPSAARTLSIAIERIPKSLAGVPSFAGDSWVLGLELQYVASS